MSIIIFGGDKHTVEKQLKCMHTWYGPCMDRISRYNKCTKCFCIERDLNTIKEYWKEVKDEAGEPR